MRTLALSTCCAGSGCRSDDQEQVGPLTTRVWREVERVGAGKPVASDLFSGDDFPRLRIYWERKGGLGKHWTPVFPRGRSPAGRR